jgi:hypothetical protein
MNKLFTAGLFSAFVSTAAIHAQQIPDLKAGNETVQFHAFGSQGFTYSDQNNWLTMKTSDGSFAMTDFGFNASSQITDKFRVGAQMYDRNIGELGNWHPTLDWAFGDYKFKDWFGVRAGKVKTVLGLFNDTQDMDFLHTFAVLPQSIYPVDLRGSTIAHLGVDLYGDISLKKRGDVAYTAYVGALPYDPYGGYPYGLSSLGLNTKNISSRQTGGDLHWNNLLNGLTFGVSYVTKPATVTGTANLQILAGLPAPVLMPYELRVRRDHRTQPYVEYRLGRLTLDGEFAKENLNGADNTGTSVSFHELSWYGAASYRISKHLELGTYHSRFYPDLKQSNLGLPSNHIFDQVVTANISLTHFWGLKLEEHFIDGYGESYSFQGFYPQDNPQGLKPRTDAFVIRTGFAF